MTLASGYAETAPSREEVDAFDGPTVVDFGTDWCGFCRAAQAPIAEAFATHPKVRHVKVEDGSGRPLGRSYRVKLWPTLIFLDAGKEVARLVRPDSVQAIKDALAKIDPAAFSQA